MASRGHHPPRWYDLFTKADFDRNHFACVVIGNYVVVAGGVFSWLEEPPLDEFGDFDDLDQRMNSVAVFDLASKKSITHTIPDLRCCSERLFLFLQQWRRRGISFFSWPRPKLGKTSHRNTSTGHNRLR